MFIWHPDVQLPAGSVGGGGGGGGGAFGLLCSAAADWSECVGASVLEQVCWSGVSGVCGVCGVHGVCGVSECVWESECVSGE